jgi:Ca2+-binding EF-hand superfamily protein
MRTLITGSAIGLVAAVAMQAKAQTTGTAAEDRCVQQWTAVDADSNGKISKSEARDATAHEFTRIDMDGDGAISVQEWKDCTAPGAIPGGFETAAGTSEDELKQEFARMDPDQTGDVSPEEAASAWKQAAGDAADEEAARQVGALFAMLDKDGDGKLTWEEWKTRGQADTAARFELIDKDANQQISKSEWAEHRARGFEEAQADAGGEPGLLVFYRRIL